MMQETSAVRRRLAVLGLIALPLLNFPLLSVPSGFFAGVPAVFLYVFVVWAALIGLAALVAER